MADITARLCALKLVRGRDDFRHLVKLIERVDTILTRNADALRDMALRVEAGPDEPAPAARGLVGVARSLLQAANGVGELSAMLSRIHTGLANLPERRASMSMVLVRLDGSVLRLASAGMPPVLVRRHDTGDIDEVLLPGVPLGTLPEAEWGEHEFNVAPGTRCY